MTCFDPKMTSNALFNPKPVVSPKNDISEKSPCTPYQKPDDPYAPYRTKWCHPGCCLSNKCVPSEVCEKTQNLTLNKVPGDPETAFKLDLTTFKQGEACDWVVDKIGDEFKIFESTFVKKILSGKKLFIIGDSQARNMFVTLVSWIENDYYFHPDFQESGRYHHTCPGLYDLMFNSRCVDIMSSKHVASGKRGSDTNYFSYESIDFKIEYIDPRQHFNEDKLAQIKGPDCYYIVSGGVHYKYRVVLLKCRFLVLKYQFCL